MIDGLINESKACAVVACAPRARSSPLRALLAVGGFCLLAALAAQVRIPVPGTTIPMTLQAPAILLAALLLPPVQAVASAVLYLGLGAAGLPVFAPGSLGLAGPTGGFLVGFVVCAGLVSVLRGRGDASAVRLFLAGLGGYVGLFALGVTWHGFWMGDFAMSVRTGLPPFLPKAVVEICLTVGLARVSRSVLVRLTGSEEPVVGAGR